MKSCVLIAVFALLAALPGRAELTQGIVKPLKIVAVPSPVLQEIISEVNVEEGTEVQEGQVLVQLRNDREKLDVQLSEKLIDLKRFIAIGQEKLFQEKMGSEEKAREARTELEIAELTMQAKRVTLEEKTIRAKISGVVVKKYKEAGEAVDRAEKLLDVMNYDQVLVEFYVKPELRKTLNANDKAHVKVVELDNADVEGKIDFIDPRNDAASGLVRIKVLVDNKDHRIKPGMKSTADFGK
jgi:membrane fusion protein (multidrug efflux system)